MAALLDAGPAVHAEHRKTARPPARVASIHLRVIVPAGLPIRFAKPLHAVVSHCTVHNTCGNRQPSTSRLSTASPILVPTRPGAQPRSEGTAPTRRSPGVPHLLTRVRDGLPVVVAGAPAASSTTGFPATGTALIRWSGHLTGLPQVEGASRGGARRIQPAPGTRRAQPQRTPRCRDRHPHRRQPSR